MEMTGKQRVQAALNHKEADRVPIDLGGWQSGINFSTYNEVKKILGIKQPTRIEEICQGLGVVDEVILNKFHVDTRYLFPNPAPADNPFLLQTDSFVDEWGIKWYRPESSVYYDMVEFPLSDSSTVELENYQGPRAEAISSPTELQQQWLELEEKNKAIFTSLAGCFEQATYIRGMEDFYTDALAEPEFFAQLIDKVLKVELSRYSIFFDAIGEHLDVVEFWGDLGTQVGPLISPELYRQVILPREKQLVELVKKKTNAKPCLHTCGSSYRFLDMLIEAGYEVLNPVQTTAKEMEPQKLKREYGKDLTFWGTVDTQHILPFGTTQQVKDEVKRMIDIFAPGGGFIIAPCHNIQANTPPENVIALFEAAYEYGKY